MCALCRYLIHSPLCFPPEARLVLRKSRACFSALFLLSHTEGVHDKGSFSKERITLTRQGHSTAGQVTSRWPGSKESLEGSDCHKHPPSAIYFLPRLPMFPEPLKIVPAAGDQGGAHCPEIRWQDQGCERCLPTSLGPLGKVPVLRPRAYITKRSNPEMRGLPERSFAALGESADLKQIILDFLSGFRQSHNSSCEAPPQRHGRARTHARTHTHTYTQNNFKKEEE